MSSLIETMLRIEREERRSSPGKVHFGILRTVNGVEDLRSVCDISIDVVSKVTSEITCKKCLKYLRV